ncbi:DUF58 domain-containing protein [Catenovulum sediminis]|uniref:DUF58 domain-containing protein n=1 Tax=Catenovulum sediminis TaxID=1740262 RepID=UPI00163D45C7|nr:DUF58 domain-containing protein [Catenovulum sediminis]
MFERWLNQRIPASYRHSLNHKNLFILPSKAGGAYLFCIMAVYLLATNYQNNLILLFAYWLIAILIIAMIASFLNLSGLKIQKQNCNPAFCGESIALEIRVDSPKAAYQLIFHDTEQSSIDMVPRGSSLHHLHFLAAKRGLFQLPRIKLMSTAPFGLFKVWTHIDFATEALVYAKPIACPQYLAGTGKYLQAGDEKNTQADEFQGIESYRQGDARSRIVWKKMVPGKSWMVKNFESGQQTEIWYSIHHLSGALEERLGQLTWLVLQAHQQGYRFGIQLFSHDISPDDGVQHKLNCLTKIALTANKEVL